MVAWLNNELATSIPVFISYKMPLQEIAAPRLETTNTDISVCLLGTVLSN